MRLERPAHMHKAKHNFHLPRLSRQIGSLAVWLSSLLTIGCVRGVNFPQAIHEGGRKDPTVDLVGVRTRCIDSQYLQRPHSLLCLIAFASVSSTDKMKTSAVLVFLFSFISFANAFEFFEKRQATNTSSSATSLPTASQAPTVNSSRYDLTQHYCRLYRHASMYA